MTRDQRIHAVAGRSLSPTERENWRTIRTQRIIAEQAIDRAENGGVLNSVAFLGEK